jgi:hypothetical protein
MKKIIILLIAFTITISVNAQTATNFNCNDCDGANTDLFQQLDSGKVVVICWAMPCSSCIPPSKTSYNVAQSFQATHPAKVLFYLCDDYANTSCASLNSWANSNSIPVSATSKRFSNAAINMLHYGTTGMPKIVVVGGNTHKVYYNSNNTVNATELQSAINAALNANNIEEKNTLNIDINLFPNPANDLFTLSLNTVKNQTLNIEIIELGGKLVYNKSVNTEYGLNKISIDTKAFANGSYIINVTDNNSIKSIRFNIAH